MEPMQTWTIYSTLESDGNSRHGGLGRMCYVHSVFISILLWLILFACKTYTSSLPTPEQLFKNGQVSEEVDKGSLTRGRALAVTECSGCHRFYFPKEYSPAEWNRIIIKKAKRLSLGRERIADIKLYFQTASRAEP